VPAGNSEAVAVAIDRLLNDEELVRRLGTAAQSRAHELFSTAKIVPEYEALYRRVLSQR
jgi:glycosyltransferase involved in cell wall biosynthesis